MSQEYDEHTKNRSVAVCTALNEMLLRDHEQGHIQNEIDPLRLALDTLAGSMLELCENWKAAADEMGWEVVKCCPDATVIYTTMVMSPRFKLSIIAESIDDILEATMRASEDGERPPCDRHA